MLHDCLMLMLRARRVASKRHARNVIAAVARQRDARVIMRGAIKMRVAHGARAPRYADALRDGAMARSYEARLRWRQA